MSLFDKERIGILQEFSQGIPSHPRLPVKSMTSVPTNDIEVSKAYRSTEQIQNAVMSTNEIVSRVREEFKQLQNQAITTDEQRDLEREWDDIQKSVSSPSYIQM